MLSFLRRWLLLLIGFVLIAIIIWVAGPYLAFAEWRPLDSVFERVTVIALVVLVWFIWRIIRRLRTVNVTDRLFAAVVKQSHAEERPSPEVAKLRESFEQAVATLKTRNSKQSLYDLPWYVFIGAPGSGKTTALTHSGLNFALDAPEGEGDPKRGPRLTGIGGTRLCDWWFTDEAVFIDTAGRFSSQDSDPEADSASWKEFLALLQRYRKRRPLNGMIVTISARDLLAATPTDRKAQADTSRKRLRELVDELHVDLPIYVMVTMCDLVAGFSEYFDDLDARGRQQVWGVTFEPEVTESGHGPRRFAAEFEALLARLNERVLERLNGEGDERRRAPLFGFPQGMAALGGPLSEFLSTAFTETRTEHRTLLRGVYLTSGTQEGTPIDRLLGSLARGLGLAPQVVQPSGPGKAYFVERLLKDVVIGEAGLAGVNRRLEASRTIRQLALYAAVGVITLALIVALSVSLARNRAYLKSMNADVQALVSVTPIRSGPSIQSFLPRLEAVRSVDDLANRYTNDVPWSMRWGLYQGASVGRSADDAYAREVDGSLVPFLANRFRQRITQSGRDPERLYPNLKAYLMLERPEQHMNASPGRNGSAERNTAFLLGQAKAEWGRGSGVSAKQGEQLSQHLQRLLERTSGIRPVPIDATLVAQARQSLASASLARLVYSWLKSEHISKAEGVRLDVLMGVGAAQVFRRASGVSLGEQVPPLFTQASFGTITSNELAGQIDTFLDERWVWGGRPPERDDRERLKQEVAAVYEEDYIRTWDAVSNDLELVPLRTVQDTINALNVLTGRASPLRAFVQIVTDNTSLVKAQGSTNGGAFAKLKTRAFKTIDEYQQKVGISLGQSDGPTVQPGEQVFAHFMPIHRLLEGEAGKTLLDGIIVRLAALQAQLQMLGPDRADVDMSSALGDPKVTGELLQLKQAARSLPSGPANFITRIVDALEGGVRQDLLRQYEQEIGQGCRQVIDGRYPFTLESRTDVNMRDFYEFFGYGGSFDRFFTNRLQKMANTAASPWTWQQGVVGPDGLLPIFEGAQRVRDAFFRPGQSRPDVPFTMTLADVDSRAGGVTLDTDGQKYAFKRGDRKPASWPGPRPGSSSATFDTKPPVQTATEDGPWSWFRLIDNGQPKSDGEMKVSIVLSGPGHSARLTIEATGGLNPFMSREWQQFSCGE